MLQISQKCQYALRGVFELARRPAGSMATVAEIAGAQAIPPRFLELIREMGLPDPAPLRYNL